MADKKISDLTAASTPLAGTEVLPIVQTSTTKKVSVANLTDGRDVSVARLDAYNVSATGIMSTFTSGWSNTRVVIEGDGLSGAGVLNIANAAATAPLPFKLKMNGTEVVDVSTTGNVKATIGNLVIGTAGKGIDFSANTHAAGMTSELLNWYEEGTWTPTLNASTLSGAVYATQLGFYTRVGNLVTLQCDVKLSALTSGGTNYLRIEGFPFTTNASAIGSSGTVYAENLTGGTLGNYIVGYIGAGQTSLNLYEQNNTGIISANGMSGARLTATSRFIFTATYRV